MQGHISRVNGDLLHPAPDIFLERPNSSSGTAEQIALQAADLTAVPAAWWLHSSSRCACCTLVGKLQSASAHICQIGHSLPKAFMYVQA